MFFLFLLNLEYNVPMKKKNPEKCIYFCFKTDGNRRLPNRMVFLCNKFSSIYSTGFFLSFFDWNILQ